MTNPVYHLTLSCNNRPGIVSTVSTYLFEAGGDIEDAQQYDDPASGRFFMRVAFNCPADRGDLSSLRAGFMPIVERLGLTWRLRSPNELRRVLLMVSKFDHCLSDIVYRWRIGELQMAVAGIVANHPKDVYAHIGIDGIKFSYIPSNKNAKDEQEAKLWDAIVDSGADLVVLARYMQILSPNLTAKLAGRCINVHHSFLPSFKGARPYQQAHHRGVKLIGATAHYVTNDLDEGPIIEQDVIRISHRDTPDDFIRKGRDIERQVLARALRYYLTDRIIMNGDKTVEFAD